MKWSFRNLLLGSKRIPSRTEYKFAMLRMQVALLLLVVSLFYVVFDYFNGLIEFIPWYGLMAAVAIFSMVLNRRQHTHAASIIILVTINIMIFLFADVDHPIGGVYFYFIASSVTGLVLFGKEDHLFLRFIFGLLPIALGITARLWDFNIIPLPSRNESVSQITFLANYVIGLFTTFIVVHFLISRNRESEQSLITSEQAISKASEALRRSEARYALALQGTRAGIYEWYLRENRVEVSDHWRSLLGYSPSEMLHVTLETFLTMVHPEDAARTSASVMNHVKNQLPYQNEVRLKTKEGTYRWFQDSGIGKTDESGELRVVIGSIIDIHERKMTEEQVRLQNELLEKANQELDYFVYSVSHDLRAPLSSIQGLTSIFSMAKDPKEKEEIVKMISDRANVLDEFIREVLDYSRNARLDLKLHPFLLWEVVDEVLAGLSHMEGFKVIDIRVEVPSDMTIVTDRERLKVVLSNLLTNAIKYRDWGKESYVAIRAGAHESMWVIEVEDNGIGIRAEHLPRVFEMFYKAHDRSTGTGLGLYIANESVRRLKGTITVRSTYAEGSAFTVRIPMPLQEA